MKNQLKIKMLHIIALISVIHAIKAYSINVSVVDLPDILKTNKFYVANRPPLMPTPFIRLPLGAVKPNGWLKRILELQAAGFHGNLLKISKFLKKEGNAWLDPNGLGELGWEEQPYWLKGYILYSYLLEREEMINEALVWIEATIKSQQPDGWFGPGEGRTGVATDLRGRDDLWPNMIMLFCLQSYYEARQDPRVLNLMLNYFKYLWNLPPERFLLGYWPKMRGGDLLYSVYWCYNHTGQDWLLELAQKVHQHTARWDQGLINLHNVNIAQGFREPATFWMQSHNPLDLQATENIWQTVRMLYGQVPGGMFGGDENCRPGYKGPRQAIETCGVVEEMLSDELLISITGNLIWADRCEEVAFNTLPATMTADFKALRYLTAPNQPQSDHGSKCPGIQNCGPMYQMNPHEHRCCQHNVGHGWPYFIQHLFYATPDNGVAAILYGPSTVKLKVGDGSWVTIEERTRYPFEDSIEFIFHVEQSTKFPFYLRVPSWCIQPVLVINSQPVAINAYPRSLIRIEKEWKEGDTLLLQLPMSLTIVKWHANWNSVSIKRGPLTYSLKIKERYERTGGTDEWPAWDIYPASPWNYGLVLNESNPSQGFKVIFNPWPEDDQPWKWDSSPIELETIGRKIPEWTLDSKGLVRELQPSPVFSDQPNEIIRLIPMGAARLRISAFPVVGSDNEGHRWKPPAETFLKASHCFEADTIEAVEDGLIPSSSNDQSIPRFTWWPRKGSIEWIIREFPKPTTISKVAIYWFDDTGSGACRPPQFYRILYLEDGGWQPVTNPRGLGIEKDKFNVTEFDPVTTTAIKVEAQLQEGFSAGILEWKLE